jgi:IS5 family transposase
MYNLSDAKIEDELKDRLSFKWFLGLEVDASPPDSTTLVRFRDRLGEETFAKAFNKVVEIAPVTTN